MRRVKKILRCKYIWNIYVIYRYIWLLGLYWMKYMYDYEYWYYCINGS
jgi:hypothetical protein